MAPLSSECDTLLYNPHHNFQQKNPYCKQREVFFCVIQEEKGAKTMEDWTMWCQGSLCYWLCYILQATAHQRYYNIQQDPQVVFLRIDLYFLMCTHLLVCVVAVIHVVSSQRPLTVETLERNEGHGFSDFRGIGYFSCEVNQISWGQKCSLLGVDPQRVLPHSPVLTFSCGPGRLDPQTGRCSLDWRRLWAQGLGSDPGRSRASPSLGAFCERPSFAAWRRSKKA